MKKKQIKIVFLTIRGAYTPRVIMLVVLPKSAIKRVLVILNMKNIRRIGDFITKAKLIRKLMLGNAYFPSPPVALADGGTFDNDIKALELAEVNAQTRAKGTAETRDLKKSIVLNDMHLLQGYVQSIADGNPVQAETIVSGSGFEMKIAAARSKNEFSAVNTKVSGTIKLIVNVKKVTGGNKRASFKWQKSSDNIIWMELPTTLKGSTLVSALTPATYMYFRFLVVLKDGESSWSEPVKVLVN